MLYCIYAHTTPNGKKYIGQTCDVKRRWRASGYNYRNCTAFYNAIKKYSWAKIKHEILEENLTLEQANEREQFFIKKYKTMDKKFGYNLTSGGKCCEKSEEAKEKNRLKSLGKKMNDESKKKLSESKKGCRWWTNGIENSFSRLCPIGWHLGMTVSKESKKKRHEASKGRESNFKGHSHTDIAKQKMSYARLGKKRGPRKEETKQKISQSHKLIMTDEIRKKISLQNMGSKNGMSKQLTVIDLATNQKEVFNCIKEATKRYGIKYKTIINHRDIVINSHRFVIGVI